MDLLVELVHAQLQRGRVAARLVAARLEALLNDPAEVIVFLLDLIT